VGLIFALCFRAAGAGQIILTDVAPQRLAAAERAGFITLDARQGDPVAAIRERTEGGADVVVDAVGTLLDQAVAAAAVWGRVVLFGMNQQAQPTVRQYDITRRELTLYGTFIGVHTFPTAIQMVESGVLRPSVFLTHTLPLAEIERGLEAMRRGEAIKVLIRP